jgi:hypothetical protein
MSERKVNISHFPNVLREKLAPMTSEEVSNFFLQADHCFASAPEIFEFDSESSLGDEVLSRKRDEWALLRRFRLFSWLIGNHVLPEDALVECDLAFDQMRSVDYAGRNKIISGIRAKYERGE